MPRLLGRRLVRFGAVTTLPRRQSIGDTVAAAFLVARALKTVAGTTYEDEPLRRRAHRFFRGGYVTFLYPDATQLVELVQPHDVPLVSGEQESGAIRLKTDVTGRYLMRAKRPGELRALATSGVLGLETSEARNYGVALPRRAWRPSRVFRVGIVREDGHRLQDLDDAGRGRELSVVLLATTTALQFLHTNGLSHSALRPENVIVTSSDRRWLLTDPIPEKATLASPAAMEDIRELVRLWESVFIDDATTSLPVLRPRIRATLPYRHATALESVLGWAHFRAQSLAAGDSIELLDRVKKHIYDATAEDEFGSVGSLGLIDLPDEWLSIVDNFAAMADTGGIEHAEFADAIQRQDSRLARGIDSYWREYIHELAAERLRDVEYAKGRVAEAGSLDAFISSPGRPSNLRDDPLLALGIVRAYEVEGEPTLEDLVREGEKQAQNTRMRILSAEFVDQQAVQERLELRDEELYALLRSGLLVAVLDHGDLLFPQFQFASADALRLVREFGTAYAASYPSWTWTSKWFEATLGGAPLADLVTDGRVDDVRDAIIETATPR